MLRVDIKLRLGFNQLPLKMQKGSLHVLLINKTRLNSTMNSTIDCSSKARLNGRWREIICIYRHSILFVFYFILSFYSHSFISLNYHQVNIALSELRLIIPIIYAIIEKKKKKKKHRQCFSAISCRVKIQCQIIDTINQILWIKTFSIPFFINNFVNERYY